jgi:EAL domain-containing protein (putative c-di-GMP-specific phosphodiesterase class I)/putative methionine-R-sulfoxide reductase with GAF domain
MTAEKILLAREAWTVGGRKTMSAEESLWHKVRAGGRLSPVFQPIVDLRSGRVAGYEALSRPTDPWGQTVPVETLLHSAREEGQEAAFDLWALASIWEAARREIPDHAMLFVNLSPLTLLDHPDALEPLEPFFPRLAVEITERSVIPDERVGELLQTLARLRQQGVRVAMDDCGAGYSGLGRLVVLRPDFAKVDMGLVRGVDTDVAKATLVEAFVRFARREGSAVVAEGVESLAEAKTLRDMGVDYAQGYLFARPQPGFGQAAVLDLGTFPGDPRRPWDAGAALGVVLHLVRLASRGLEDSPGLYEAMAHTLLLATGADAAVVRRLHQGRLVAVASQGRPAHPEVSVDDPEAVCARALREGRTVTRQMAAHGNLAYPAAAAAPVVLPGGTPWGTVSIGYTGAGELRPQAVDTLNGLGALATVLLRASGQTPLLPRATALDALRLLTGSARDREELLAQVLKVVEEETGAHDGWLGLVGQGRVLRLVTSRGQVQEVPLAPFLDPSRPEGRTPPGRALREGRTVVVDDVRREPSLEDQRDDLLAQGIVSAVAIPVRVEGRVEGVLKVYHGARGAFHPAQRVYLEEVASLLGVTWSWLRRVAPEAGWEASPEETGAGGRAG